MMKKDKVILSKIKFTFYKFNLQYFLKELICNHYRTFLILSRHGVLFMFL